MQTTLKSSVSFAGTGLHTGRVVRMTIHPASAEYGIWFRRSDVAEASALVPARWDAVGDARLCTRVVNGDGVSVSTIEHVMAALAGTGVHNALIEIDGPEVPLLDGSSAQFVDGILSRGLIRLDAPVIAIEVQKPVIVRRGEAEASLRPEAGLTMEFHIDFADAAIGRQNRTIDLANGAFVHELCDSRTFCRRADIDAMRAQGLIIGGSMTSAVVVDGERVMTPGGLRHADEPVRHKMLDALGDLATAGRPILGHYSGIRAGHAMTNLLLRALFSDPSAYRLVECDEATAARLPGAGVTRADMPALAA